MNDKPQNIEELYWRSSELTPIDAGSYLVVFKDGNSMEYYSDEPHVAEYDYWPAYPKEWTIFDSSTNQNQVISSEIVKWMPKPFV